MSTPRIFFRPGILIYTCCILCIYSCTTKNQGTTGITAEPSFYHWKSVFAPGKTELDALEKNAVHTLYLRYFDVDWNNTSHQPNPIAQVRIPGSDFFSKNKRSIVPTIFITNQCIQKIDSSQCDPLAANIIKLIREISITNQIDSIKEIQIDCDWTVTTKEKYFSLLRLLQQKDTGHLYSATIRLFQVKYKNEAGIPPVKKGLLMCYNMGNLKDIKTNNSILDPAELRKYTSNLHEYPLALDVALPLFSWYVLFRDNQYTGLIQESNGEAIRAGSAPAGKNRFQIKADTVINGIVLKQGDILRYENCSYEDIVQAAAILKEKINNKNFRLSLYHLDSLILSKYSTHEIENIFSSFR